MPGHVESQVSEHRPQAVQPRMVLPASVMSSPLTACVASRSRQRCNKVCVFPLIRGLPQMANAETVMRGSIQHSALVQSSFVRTASGQPWAQVNRSKVDTPQRKAPGKACILALEAAAECDRCGEAELRSFRSVARRTAIPCEKPPKHEPIRLGPNHWLGKLLLVECRACHGFDAESRYDTCAH